MYNIYTQVFITLSLNLVIVQELLRKLMTRGLLHAQLGTGDLTAVMGCLICARAIDLGSARRVNRPFLQGPNRTEVWLTRAL